MTTAILSEKLAAFIEPFGIPANALQKKSYEHLLTLDFPTTKTEYWKYTRTGKIQNARLQTPTGTVLNNSDLEDIAATGNYVIIENGLLRTDLSKIGIPGVTVSACKPESVPEKFNSSLNQDHIFTALNTSFFKEIISVSVQAKTEMDEPLQLIFVTTGKAVFSNPRLLVDVQKSASARFLTSFVSFESEGSFNNVVSEFFVDENASVTVEKIQNETDSNFHVSTEEVVQQKNSIVRLNAMILDGGLVRNNINIAVGGENCESHMNAAIIAKGNSHVDNHTFVDHRKPNCFSNENYKYVLEDKATGVFNGRVIVQQHAQKINAYQKNTNILLSDFAQINSKPELEIYADDVKCSHGSTTGQLDENAIFYLQTRGISKSRAKKLLVSAFIEEITEQFSSESMRDQIHRILVEKHNWTH